MNDYDVWVVNDYYTVYFIIFADSKEQAEMLIPQRLDELGLPSHVHDLASEIKIIPIGVTARGEMWV